MPLPEDKTHLPVRSGAPRSSRAIWIVTVGIVFLIGLSVGLAQRLATLHPDDDSWLGTARDGWASMYVTMTGDVDRSKIEYFVYHPDVDRQVVTEYAIANPRIGDVKETLYDSASVIVIERENRSVLSQIESQPWAQFAIRGELMFFCH